tara:strand:+ start:1070 stop:1504 length:435 start_codon:yes stop_codon:yes gene_type:complete
MTDTKNGKDLIVFLDTIGRTIIAERLDEDDKVLNVQNPAVVNIAPQQAVGPNGEPIQKMALQLFPLFFREFLAAKDESVKFRYIKDNITMSVGDIALDFKIGIQYEQLFISTGEISGPDTGPALKLSPDQAGSVDENLVKLFDE